MLRIESIISGESIEKRLDRRRERNLSLRQPCVSVTREYFLGKVLLVVDGAHPTKEAMFASFISWLVEAALGRRIEFVPIVMRYTLGTSECIHRLLHHSGRGNRSPPATNRKLVGSE